MSRATARTVLLLSSFVPSMLAAAADANLTTSARIQPTLIGVDQTVTFTLEAEGTGLSELRLDPRFALENFKIVSGPSQSKNFQFVNGRASRSQSLTWRLQPLEVGSARVNQIVLTVNDQTFELPDQVVEIQEEPVETTDAFGRSRPFDPFEDFPFFQRRERKPEPSAEPKLFLRAEVSPKEPFAGQQVLYTLYLFTQADVGAINPESIPDFEGFWVEDIKQPEKLQPQMQEIQGQRYGRVVLLQKALFPMRPGEVRLEPVRARLVASVPEYSWLGSVIERRREVHRTSNPVTLTVRPLPAPPDGFRGAVGKLSLATALEPAELRVGEAATLTVTLNGQGNIQGLPEPELPVLDGVRVFPAEQKSSSRVSGTRVRGTKTWSYVLVPDQAGDWEIPSPSLDFFDPFDGKYREAKSKSSFLSALPALDSVGEVAVGEVPLTSNNEPTVDSPSEVPTRGPWFRNPLVLAAPAAVALSLIFVPLFRRWRRKNQMCARLGERLRAAASVPQSRRAAEEIEDAWREFLEKRFSIPSTCASNEWPTNAREVGASELSTGELVRVVEDLNYLRYAPELSASEELKTDLIARSLRLARSLA